MWTVIGVVVVVVLLDLLIYARFHAWMKRKKTESRWAICSICGCYTPTCCSDFGNGKKPINPRCVECCDHTHGEKTP